ncbi:hypothetical protein AGMMS50262_19320 [Bacteroidia bacterium]|nr:hypothetical protein AGMMS50262_19320 [Bacteroidia bacterium]
MWKDFFYFSHRERQGILLLIALIIGILAGKWLFSRNKTEAVEKETAVVENPVSEKPPSEKPEKYVPFFPKQSPPTKRKTFVREETRTYYNTRDTVAHRSPAVYPKTEKLVQGTVIELNTADTTDLKKIPGIGPAFARRIVQYRNLLGGYHRIEQLQEVYGMYEELYEKITPFLTIDGQQLTQISVNSTSLDQLRAHPYINFYHAKAIIELRKKKGRLENIGELQLLEEFTPADWLRIAPYLAF